MTTNRLEAFSDGVFAIAMTLLVLDLHVSAEPGHLARALGREWPHYAAFVVSFLTIGIIWVNHHGVFDRVAQVNRTLLFINLIFLMTVVVIPFPTSVLAEHLHSGSDEHVAAAVYSATFLVMGCAFYACWRYAASRSELLHAEMTPTEIRRLVRRNVIGIFPYLLAIGIAFVSAPASLVLCFMAAIYYVLPGNLPEGRSSAQAAN